MSFYDIIDETIGDADALTDIRLTVRRLWFYDFEGYPTRLWQGQGKLFTSDGNEWIGTIDQNGNDLHNAPALQDGRDGSSGTYEFSLNIPNFPDQDAFELYQGLKADQGLVNKRDLICYHALFNMGESLRPSTPIVFYKALTMMGVRFTESIQGSTTGGLSRSYQVTLKAKDANYGRVTTPRGTYADTIQKQRAAELGVSVDKGCEYLASLANRTYQIP